MHSLNCHLTYMKFEVVNRQSVMEVTDGYGETEDWRCGRVGVAWCGGEGAAPGSQGAVECIGCRIMRFPEPKVPVRFRLPLMGEEFELWAWWGARMGSG